MSGRLGNFEEEIELIDKAYKIQEQLNDSAGMRFELFGIFSSYYSIKDTSGMRKALKKIEAFEYLIHGSGKYYYFQNKGIYYYCIENYNKALELSMLALTTAIRENMLDAKATILMFLGKTEKTLGRLAKAEDYINTALELSIKNDLTHEWLEALEVGIQVAEDQKKYGKAFTYFRTYDSLKLEIYIIERINNINYTEKKLKLAEKDQQIINQKLDLKNEEIKTQQANSKFLTTLYILIFAIVLVIIISFIIWRLKTLNNKIESQKVSIQDKNDIIQATLDHLNESLRYSERLQHSLLPSIEKVNSLLGNNFIFYQPKKIVSGDFYWVEEVGDKKYFAVADCTGHGVPGAMVSMVCVNALNIAIKEKNIYNPAEILEFCSEKIKDNFNSSHDFLINDGMDISLCYYDKNNKELVWADANNPIWIIRKKGTLKVDNTEIKSNFCKNENELFEIKPVKRPVGNSLIKKDFKSHTIQLLANDIIYLFSDGYADQFGSAENTPTKPGGKKFKYKQLKNVLLIVAEERMDYQKTTLKTTIDKWMGDYEQIDDICIMGVKVD